MIFQTKNFSLGINNKFICRELNLEINRGDFWGILGPNGSGKTTLLQTFAGLRKDFTGELFLDNILLSNINRKVLATKIGILFQEMQLVFPQNVFDYCLASRYPFKTNFLENEKIICEALRVVELENFLEKNILELSGGEKRRLTIASVLSQTPKLFFLDEPTNHLDIRHQIRVMHHFKQLTQQNQAVMMAIHDLTIAKQFCNKLLMVFENGEILQGSIQTIFTQENLERLYSIRVMDGGVGGLLLDSSGALTVNC